MSGSFAWARWGRWSAALYSWLCQGSFWFAYMETLLWIFRMNGLLLLSCIGVQNTVHSSFSAIAQLDWSSQKDQTTSWLHTVAFTTKTAITAKLLMTVTFSWKFHACAIWFGHSVDSIRIAWIWILTLDSDQLYSAFESDCDFAASDSGTRYQRACTTRMIIFGR